MRSRAIQIGPQDDSNATPAEVSRNRILDERTLSCLCDHLCLSPRETQIVQRLFLDTKEQSIARSMGISAHTVRTHVERLYRKLHVTTRTELVVRLYEAFLQIVSQENSSLEPICPRWRRSECPFRC